MQQHILDDFFSLRQSIVSAVQSSTGRVYSFSDGSQIINQCYYFLSQLEMPWHQDRNRTLSLFLQISEEKQKKADFSGTLELVNVFLEQDVDLQDRAKAYGLKLSCLLNSGRIEDALSVGEQALAALEIELVDRLPDLDLKLIEKLPLITDSYELSKIRIIKLMGDAAYVGRDTDFVVQVINTQLEHSLRCGNSSLALIGYADYAVLLSGYLGELEQGFELAETAYNLQEKYGDSESKTLVLALYYGYIYHWCKSSFDVAEFLLTAFQTGIEVGELFFGGLAGLRRCDALFFNGEALATLEQEYGFLESAFIQAKLQYHLPFARIGQQLVRALSSGNTFWQDSLLEGNPTLAFAGHTAQLMVRYLTQQGDAVDSGRLAAEHKHRAAGWLLQSQHNFYYSLALLAAYPTADETEGQRLLVQVAANQEQLATWAYHAPMNFQHRFDLVEAERQRLTGGRDAISLYFSAIEGAEARGYVADWALACERLAVAWIELRELRLAQQYLRRARQGYLQWGATALAEQVLQRYGESIWDVTVEATAGSTATEAIRVFILSQQEEHWRVLLELAEWEIAADVVTLRVSSPEMALAIRSQLKRIVLPEGIELRIVSNSR